MKKNTSKKELTSLIILNILESCLWFLYMLLHMSFFKWSPFYESSGFQMFLFFYLMPVHLVIGILLFVVDKQKKLSKLNKLSPFLALYPSLVFSMTNFFSDDYIFKALSLMGIILFAIFIISLVISYKKKWYSWIYWLWKEWLLSQICAPIKF